MASSTSKGDKLEDEFHQYLLDQQIHGELVFGAYPPENCRIYKKKEYYCREREANVEFDVVLELRPFQAREKKMRVAQLAK